VADYNANIRVSADTKRAESQLSKLEKTLNQLSDFTLKLNSRSLQAEANKIGQSVRGIGERGALGALTLAAGKATTAVTALGAKFGILGAAAASAGATINGALGGVPAVVGDILNQVGSIPNAFGLAAVAAMAFAPQLTKAAASAVGLGAAVDKAVGAGVTSKIAGLTASVGQLNLELNATKTSFADLLGGSSLNKLVAQLNDAQKQVGEYVAFSDESVTAVQQLLTVERLVTREKRAQAALVNQLNADTLLQNARIQQNLNASRNSRAGSGFNAFSTAATALEGSRAVDKAIRRNFEKRAAGAPPAPAAPLMLPSSEMLLSGGRRIQRLTADPGVEAARAYTQELTRAVGTGRQLDGIFTQVSKAMAATADGAAEGNRITQSWAKALREMAEIQSDITELAAKETQLQRQTSDAQRRKNFGRQAESLALGVGFPLLFGGGVGSVAGAAAGSFVGSGFGGQILGGALGQIADQFAQAAAKMGSALRDPIQNFREIADAGLLAGKSQERYIQKLIDAGRVAEASALIQGEIIKKIGVQGYRDLQNAGAASDKLNKAMAELNLQMQAAVAGPLAAFTSWLAGIVSIGNGVTRNANRQSDIFSGLSRSDQQALKNQESRILQGANLFNERQKRAQVQSLYESYAGRSNMTPPSVSMNGDAARQARATTAEMQAQVNLAAKQLGLAGLTLEKDGARYVQAAKAVALQEYDNRLLEIKNSWIGKILNKEQDLALRRAASLEYQAKLRGIDAQVAQKATADNNSRLQQEQALLKVRSDALNTIVQYKTQVLGEETGLKTRLELNKRIEGVRRAELEVEQELALREAAKNGTLETTQRIYAARKALLEMILDIEKQTTEQKLEQLRIDGAIDKARKTKAFAEQMQGVFAQTPMRRSPLEQLRYEQAQRRGSQLNPMFQEVSELQLQLSDKTLDPTSDRAKELNSELTRVRGNIEKMSAALTFVEGQEVVWFKQRAGVEGLNNVLQSSSNLLANSISSGIDAITSSTENLSGAFADLSTSLVQAVGKLLIFQGLAQLFGGVLGGGAGNPQGVFSLIGRAFGYGAKEGAYWPGGFQAFADGGMVTRPTMGLIGEGGEAEYIIPASKMRGAMSRYASGARGSSVIPAGSDSGDGSTTAVLAPGAIDVRYTVERINTVDYVTADQFQRGMAQAAQQGAAQGEQRALRSLQNNRSTRSRLGLR